MLWQGILLSVTGATFYTVLFRKFELNLGPVLRRLQLQEYDVLDTCCKCVSSVHAVISSGIGIFIIFACNEDPKYDSHWLTNHFAYFCFPYFMYDLLCMYYVYTHREGLPESTLGKIRSFISDHGSMVLHHTVLFFLGFPATVHYRKNLGDHMMGFFYFMELSTPFVSCRAILSKFHMKKSLLYMANGALMVTTFFLCRIVPFPYFYWRYARYSNQTILQVAQTIPKKCNISSAVFFALQCYWFFRMVKGAIKLAESDRYLEENKEN